MIIVAGGDSFVWGSELADSPHGGPNGYSRSTFPSLLAQNNQYVCAAYPGFSNSLIAENIKNKKPKGNVFFIVCWTWPARDDKIHTSAKAVKEVQQYCENNQYSYLFTCADNCLLEWLDDSTNWDNWFLFPPGVGANQTEEPRGFYQWAVENKYDVGPESHPLEKAHIDAAILMKDKFNELVKKSIQ
jgi:hypothetical protein